MQATARPEAGLPNPSAGRILVIDDDADVRKAVQRALEHAGYDVQVASSGAGGLEVAGTAEFDVAIVDYEMPGLNGIEVLKGLRELHPMCARILSSGRADGPVITRAVNDGEISRIVPKPVTPNELCDAVAGALAVQAREADRYVERQARRATQFRERFRAFLTGADLVLAVQPIVDAIDGLPRAYEALIRSNDPEFPGPLQVLQAAEAHGMIGELATRVIALATDWLARIPAGRSLFLNLHPEELRDANALAERMRPLQPFADRLVLEITESAGAQGTPDWTRSLALLREMGFALAVDDLGSGYSSLSVLAEVKPEFIKIDMSIVRNVDRDTHKRDLVELICQFAAAVGATVVAEGVETWAEATTLRDCHARLLQGYFFARPALELAPDPS